MFSSYFEYLVCGALLYFLKKASSTFIVPRIGWLHLQRALLKLPVDVSKEENVTLQCNSHISVRQFLAMKLYANVWDEFLLVYPDDIDFREQTVTAHLLCTSFGACNLQNLLKILNKVPSIKILMMYCGERKDQKYYGACVQTPPFHSRQVLVSQFLSL